ncbi:MAG TPA: TonB-dependent receptor [Verrucomicrobiae bacterium]|nr:TonB-dependent receptor [Verrucomicrobiae bacterium]
MVTGTFEPVPLDESDRSVSVLSVRDWTLLLNTLPDVLRLDPSIDLQARAPDGVQNDLSIRGSTFGQTLVLLNGQRLDDVQSGHHDMDIPVPLDSIERVEVLRGSGSAFYGSDASGGVINILTAPPEGWEVRVRAAGGSFGDNQQSVSLADTFGNFAEQVSFSRDFSDGFIADRDYRNLQFASETSLQTALGFSHLTLAYMDHPFGADQFYGPYNSWEDTKTWWLGYRQPLGKKTWVNFAYRRHSDLFVLLRDDPPVYTNHHHDEDFQLSIRRSDPVNANTTVSYGIEGLHESIVSNNLGNHSRSRGAAYAALDFRALKRFSLSIAAREEVYRNLGGEFSPSVSGGAWLNQHLKFRASASRAFRVPTYTDLYYSDPANQGNPHLLPETAWTYEGGADWIPSSRLRAAATVFERRERNGIDYFRTSPDAIWMALNIDSLNFTGVESSLHYSVSRSQTLDLAYTWLLGRQNTVPFGDTKYTFNYPSDSGVLSWNATLPGGMLARTRLGVINRQAQDPYPLWDFYLARSAGKIHPFLQLANITSSSYQEIQGVVMPGRSISGGLEFLLRGR